MFCGKIQPRAAANTTAEKMNRGNPRSRRFALEAEEINGGK
jgi:hypothetical protein